MLAIGAPGSIARAASERDWNPGEFAVYEYGKGGAVLVATGTRAECEPLIYPGRHLINGDHYRKREE